jgi:hypothetical protein
MARNNVTNQLKFSFVFKLPELWTERIWIQKWRNAKLSLDNMNKSGHLLCCREHFPSPKLTLLLSLDFENTFFGILIYFILYFYWENWKNTKLPPPPRFWKNTPPPPNFFEFMPLFFTYLWLKCHLLFHKYSEDFNVNW